MLQVREAQTTNNLIVEDQHRKRVAIVQPCGEVIWWDQQMSQHQITNSARSWTNRSRVNWRKYNG